MESIETTAIGDELWSLPLEDLLHCLIGTFRMGMRLGVGDTFIHKPGVQCASGEDHLV